MKSTPKSPDLNPIEIIWADLINTVRNKILNEKIDLIIAKNEYQQSLTTMKCGRYIAKLKKVP